MHRIPASARMATAMIYSHAKRSLATLVSLLLLLLWVPAALMSTPASAASGATTVTPVPVNENCNGVIPTPGSENTEKKLIGGTLEPGGTAIFEITYPIDPADIGQTFTVTDCPVLGANVHDAQAYQFTFVPNNTSFTVEFTLIIPADTPIGTSYCNYAKTTASPSAPQASNRKAGPACFTVGGNLRVEKHATGNTTDLLAGAQFDVSCPTAAPTVPITESPVIITGLVDGNGDPVVATYDTATHAWTASGTADPGFIGISGPSGTVCTVTETAAPPGYELPDVTTHQYTIPVGTSQQVEEWFNAPSVPAPTGGLTLVKHVDKATASYGDTLTYTFDAATTGDLDQTNVVVTDVVPDHTTYVAGSAGCTDAGTCVATYSSATNTITWQLGDIAAGDAARKLTFQVTIDQPAGFDPAIGVPAETILNSGVIGSTETQPTPSNQVKTPVTAVLGIKLVKQPVTPPATSPTTLPFTGPTLPLYTTLAIALTIIGAGLALAATRRRQH